MGVTYICIMHLKMKVLLNPWTPLNTGMFYVTHDMYSCRMSEIGKLKLRLGNYTRLVLQHNIV